MRKVCLPFALAILTVFTIPSYAEVSTYSDAWACDYGGSYVDSEGDLVLVEPFDVRICACSVTDGYGDGIYHEYSAYVKVTDPNGFYNDATNTSYGYGTVARADVSLPWGGVDGDYTITLRHFSNCPANEFIQWNLPVFISISQTSYKLQLSTPASCTYIKDCPPGTDGCGYNRIKKPKIRPTEGCPGFALAGHLRVNGSCVRIAGLATLRNTPFGVCN